LPTADVAFESLVLDGLGRLLLDDADLAAASAALAAAAPRLAEIPALAKKHKVTTVIAANAEALTAANAGAEAAALRELLAADMRAAVHHRQLLENELPTLASALAGGAVLIKGLASARHYPPPYARWMRDIDVLCRSWTDAMSLLAELAERGYRLDPDESPWIKADPANGTDLYGQIFLVRDTGDDFCRVDVHFGTYSVGYSGYLDVDWAALTSSADIGGLNVPVLRQEAALLLALAHALSDGYIAVKDVNDFAAAAVGRAPVDWELVAREIRRHRLEPQGLLLARHCLALYADARVADAATRLAACCAGARIGGWRTHDRSWGRRALVNADFTYRWQRGRGDTIGHAAWRTVQCYLFYRRRMALAVRARSPREAVLHKAMRQASLREWRLSPDACTMLIDAQVVRDLAPPRDGAAPVRPASAVSVAPGIDVVTADGHDFVRLQGRLFVPTTDALVTPAQAAAVPGA
jgi:hypothetical protein